MTPNAFLRHHCLRLASPLLASLATPLLVASTCGALVIGCSAASSSPTSNDPNQSTATSAGDATGSGSGSSSSSGNSSGSSGGNGAQGSGGGGATVGAGQLFGSHTQAYASGSIVPSGGQAALDAATSSFYDAWKAKYLIKDCGGYYVATTLDDNSGGGQATNAITVSEAHGYGMLAAALMAGHDPDAHAIFDGLYTFFRAHPSSSSPDLMAWQQVKGCMSSADNDSATDGDLDIAYSLLLASRLWPGGDIDYGAQAKKVIAAIGVHEMNATTHLPLLGDWSTAAEPTFFFGTRPSDFIADHFRAFGAASDDSATWKSNVDGIYTLVATMQSKYAPKTGLVPDFVITTNATPAPAPASYLEDTTDGEYAYNACRVPWRLGTDALVNGDERAKTALTPINAWIMQLTGGDAGKIGTSYKLDGTTTVPGDASMAFVAPFGVSAMVDAKNQAWLDAIWKAVTAQSLAAEGDYFGNTVKLLSMIVMSHNWWGPQ